MFSESQDGYFRAREAAGDAGGWPLARLAAGARFAGRIHDEPLLGVIGPGPRPTSWSSTTRRRHRSPATTSAPTGSSACRRARCATCSSRASLVVEDRRSTRVDEVEVAADGAREAGRLWGRMDAIPPHDFEPRRSRLSSTCRTCTRSVRAWSTHATPRSAGSRPCGRRRADRPGGHGPHGCLRGRDEPDQGRGRRHLHLDPQRRAPGCHLLDARRSRPRPGDARPGRVVGPARQQGRHRPPQAAAGHAETVEATRRLLAMERVTYHGEFIHLDDVEIDIVHGDRSPSTCRSTSAPPACR